MRDWVGEPDQAAAPYGKQLFNFVKFQVVKAPEVLPTTIAIPLIFESFDTFFLLVYSIFFVYLHKNHVKYANTQPIKQSTKLDELFITQLIQSFLTST